MQLFGFCFLELTWGYGFVSAKWLNLVSLIVLTLGEIVRKIHIT